MKVDDELLANSDQYEFKSRGISTVVKYYFGPYAIVSGKAGWITTRARQRNRGFFFPETSIVAKSDQKISYVFTSQGKDTVYVNALVNSITQSLHQERRNYTVTELQDHQDNFVAEFLPSFDSSTWGIKLTTTVGSQVPDGFLFFGELTNGIQRISIVPIKERADGKRGLMDRVGVVHGYEFQLHGQSVAAIQANGIWKNYIWLKRDLPENVKIIVSSAAPTILMLVTRLQDQ